MPGKAPPTDLGVGLPYVSTTLQISPGVRENRPVPGKDLKGECVSVSQLGSGPELVMNVGCS